MIVRMVVDDACVVVEIEPRRRGVPIGKLGCVVFPLLDSVRFKQELNDRVGVLQAPAASDA